MVTMVDYIADRIANGSEIRRGKQFPNQYAVKNAACLLAFYPHSASSGARRLSPVAFLVMLPMLLQPKQQLSIEKNIDLAEDIFRLKASMD